MTSTAPPSVLIVSSHKLAPVATALLSQKAQPKNVGNVVGEIQLEKNPNCPANRHIYNSEFLEDEDEDEDEPLNEPVVAQKVILPLVSYGDVFFVNVKQDELLLAHGFAQNLLETLKPKQILILAPGNTVADNAVHKMTVGSSPLDADVPVLQSPNFISGLGAALLTRAQRNGDSATALIVQNVGTQVFERYQSDTFQELTKVVGSVLGLDSAKAQKELRADDGVAGLYL